MINKIIYFKNSLKMSEIVKKTKKSRRDRTPSEQEAHEKRKAERRAKRAALKEEQDNSTESKINKTVEKESIEIKEVQKRLTNSESKINKTVEKESTQVKTDKVEKTISTECKEVKKKLTNSELKDWFIEKESENKFVVRYLRLLENKNLENKKKEFIKKKVKDFLNELLKEARKVFKEENKKLKENNLEVKEIPKKVKLKDWFIEKESENSIVVNFLEYNEQLDFINKSFENIKKNEKEFLNDLLKEARKLFKKENKGISQPKKSKWNDFVKLFRSKNEGMSYEDALTEGSPVYKKLKEEGKLDEYLNSE